MLAKWLSRIAIYSLTVVAILYLAALAALAMEQRNFLFMPAGEIVEPQVAGLRHAEVLQLKTSDGERLLAWYVAPSPGKPLILFFHGQGGSIATPSETLKGLTLDGNGILAVEYRGYPGSTGKPSETGLLLDAEAAYAKALALGISANHIVAFGQSLGSGVAVALAAGHPVGAVILESPYTSTIDVAAERFWMFPVRLVMLDQFHSDQRIAAVRAPLLIVHGTLDSSIPITFGKKLFALAEEPKTFITVRDGGHLPINAVMPSVRQWIARAVRS